MLHNDIKTLFDSNLFYPFIYLSLTNWMIPGIGTYGRLTQYTIYWI